MNKEICEKTCRHLAEILERSGYENALELINDELVPLAREKHISIDDAIAMYENGDEDQDTSWQQLWLAMREMSSEDVALYEKLDVYTPL